MLGNSVKKKWEELKISVMQLDEEDVLTGSTSFSGEEDEFGFTSGVSEEVWQ